MKKRRKELNLSLTDLEDLSGISKSTIIKIEGGNYSPSIDTLIALSSVLKTNLLKTLSPSYKLEKIFDKENISEIEYLVEKMLDNNQYCNIPYNLKILNQIYDSLDDEELALYLYQIILFLDGIYLKREVENYKLAYENFLEALNLTIKGFDINNFDSFIYNTFELRILMNIALVLNKLGKNDLSKNIFLFLLKNLDENSQLYASTLHNLAIHKFRNNQYKQALALINRAISLSKKYRNSSKLHSTYYEKGLIEYNLGDENYKNSFETSKSLAMALGYDDFLRFLEEKMEKYQKI